MTGFTDLLANVATQLAARSMTVPHHVIVTESDPLRRIIGEVVASHLKAHLPELVRQATTPPYMTTEKVLTLTGWSKRQLAYKKSKGELSFIKRGRTVLYPTDALYAYLEEGHVPARRGPLAEANAD